MTYLLKHFDTTLIKFTLNSTAIEGLSVEIIEAYESHQSLFPLDLELSNNGLLKWLKRRVIPKNRAFVQNFLAKLNLNVNNTQGIIDICKGLSVNDCYWVVDENFKGDFDKYNLYENRFNRILSLIAYTGYGETRQTAFVSSPELTTDGMLAKCWRRINGKITLYKAGTTGAANTGNEPYSEFYAYQIAQAMGLNAVKYNLSKWRGQLFCT
ncbi:MAG: XRE family transcriptional regulator, partial [Methylococcaceae bacterium]|nr:XRE family transcriptional regulator [Methylococcaceae bacterium]